MSLQLPKPKSCGFDPQCFVDHAVLSLQAITSEIDFLDEISFFSIIIAGICGIVATVMIALQGDENRGWTRPIGIVATALVTGITGLTSSLNIPETKDKLIDSAFKITIETNNFVAEVEGKSEADAKEIVKKFANSYSLLKADLLRIKGSPAKFYSESSPAAKPGEPK